MRWFAAILLVLGCGGCALFGGSGLERSALEYYEFRLGHRPGLEYSSFFSPEYRKLMDKADLELLDSKMKYKGGTNDRYATVQLADIAVSIEGKFALTKFRGQDNAAVDSEESVKWVKAGNKWCLYMGTDAEISAYGAFPDGLPAPDLSTLETNEPGNT